ncbi:MAG: hypothetical protein R2706_16760 [Acidimicrobiales bacterium]
MADTRAYISSIEQAIIDTIADFGVAGSASMASLVSGSKHRPVWKKIAAVGVRLSRGRSMHGFALNVDVDLGWFSHIPCGITDKSVTSLRALGVDASVAEVVGCLPDAAANLAPGRRSTTRVLPTNSARGACAV